MTDCPTPLWHQPPGPWRERGAHLAALQLGQARPVSTWPAPPWQDHLGYTLWHYWAASWAPMAQWPALTQSAHRASHDQASHAGCHPWHLLALRGHHDAMEGWLGELGHPRVGVWHGDGLLQCAIWSGNAATVSAALALDEEAINRLDKARMPPLVTALYRGDAALMAILIQAGADPDLADPVGRSALHHAALLGEHVLLGELEDAGGDGGLEDKDGRTPATLIEHRGALVGPSLRAHWAHKYTAKLAF